MVDARLLERRGVAVLVAAAGECAGQTDQREAGGAAAEHRAAGDGVVRMWRIVLFVPAHLNTPGEGVV